jgi:transcriptional regulator with XRE-family HTH domain
MPPTTTAARRRTALAERRKRLGLTQETLAEQVGVSAETVASWERGIYSPQPSIRPRLAGALQSNVVELERLLDPDAPPIELNGHGVARWLSHYDSLVLAAGRIAKCEMNVVPALLQTDAYAAVVERLGPDPISDDTAGERVEIRMARQEVLHRDDPAVFRVALDESVLLDVVGSRQTMADQLGHLCDMAALAHVEIRVLPRDGGAICAVSGFELLTKPGDVDPFMVCTFDVGGARYREQPGEVAQFRTMFDHLMGIALDPTESLRRIEGIRESYR